MANSTSNSAYHCDKCCQRPISNFYPPFPIKTHHKWTLMNGSPFWCQGWCRPAGTSECSPPRRHSTVSAWSAEKTNANLAELEWWFSGDTGSPVQRCRVWSCWRGDRGERRLGAARPRRPRLLPAPPLDPAPGATHEDPSASRHSRLARWPTSPWALDLGTVAVASEWCSRYRRVSKLTEWAGCALIKIRQHVI